MNKNRFKTIIISNFNTDTFVNYLNNNKESPLIEATAIPFGQAIQTLISKDLNFSKNKYDFIIIWTQAENIIISFKNKINYIQTPIDKILYEVDEFTKLLEDIQKNANLIFMPTWIIPTYNRGYGLLDLKKDIGIENTLAQMNLRLSENLKNTSNFFLLNTRKWIELVGKNAFNPELWYTAKIPFGNEVFKEAARDIKFALTGIFGKSRKIIVLDLDNTLWGGIAGDIGWENIKLGGHDYIGEAYSDFQRALLALKNRGILLSIVSKNEEKIALEVINKHPEMILKQHDFVGWKINWKDKAQNIIDLISELNLGLHSVVFIDDNPTERARIKESLPEVLVPDWPENIMLYKKALLSLGCFDTPIISKEDHTRTKMYLNARKSLISKKSFKSLDEWLKSLKIKIKVEELNKANINRTIQLLNKTNQMNLSTRRMTELELINWLKPDNRKLWTFFVSDKFSRSGLTGVISVEIKNNTGKIIDFVLSCRVFGHKIEEAMLYILVKYCQSLKIRNLIAKYIKTSKNKPCLDFYQKSGFDFNKRTNIFSWDLKKDYPFPEVIQIENKLSFL